MSNGSGSGFSQPKQDDPHKKGLGMTCGSTGQRAFEFLLPGAPQEIVPFLARTAAQHIFYSHVTRRLLGQALDGGIEGDLAESWEVSPDFKRFDFKLKKAFWSDGTPLLARDILRTFEAGMKIGSTTHFDFGVISGVSLNGDSAIVINLKKSSPNFLRAILVPETGVLHEKSLLAQKIATDHPTSGAYVFNSWSDGVATITRNSYFESALKGAPECAILKATDITNFKPASGDPLKIDLAWMPSNMPTDLHNEMLATGKVSKIEPPIAFSYFLAFNPDSIVFKSLRERRLVQASLAPGRFQPKFNGPQYVRADQLYQPDGPGRPSQEWIKDFWSNLQKEHSGVQSANRSKKPLRLAYSKVNAFHKSIEEELQKLGYDLQPVVWANSAEYVEIVSNPQRYDAILLNNDFSSVDLLENLQVTFNVSRPYIKLPKGAVELNVMKDAIAEADPSKRYGFYEKIGKNLLEQARIVPLAYERIILYHGKHVDMSQLSTVSPDLRLWRVKVVTK